MAEAAAMTLFLVLLLGLQLKEQRSLVIKAKRSPIKIGLAAVLGIGLLLIFWPTVLSGQIKLSVFSLLIVAAGFFSEGLGAHQVVRLGLLNGSFDQFKRIEIETLNSGATFVTFYKSETNHFSLIFKEEPTVIEKYLTTISSSTSLNVH